MKRTPIKPDPSQFPTEFHSMLTAPVYDRSCSPDACICQGKVDTKKHHSIRSPVRFCTELGFYNPERPQVSHNYSNEHTRPEALEHP